MKEPIRKLGQHESALPKPIRFVVAALILRSVAEQESPTNGLSLDYSSGQVEGNVNRIKMIKRQMFGRAKSDLLRKRVLAR